MALRKPIAQVRRDRMAIIAGCLVLASCAAMTAVLVLTMAPTTVLSVFGAGMLLGIAGAALTALSD